MALGVNDLTPITEVTPETKFEGAVSQPDSRGRFGRKVTGTQIEVFINRAGGEVDKNIDGKVKAEADRAKETEGDLDNLNTKTKSSLVAAVNETDTIAKAALQYGVAADEELPKKADKIITEQTKTLAEADVGDVLGLVAFDTGSVPAPPGAAGSIIFTDGSRFDLAASGNMTYTGADGTVTNIITDEVWIDTSVDTGGAAIQSEANANSGAWLSGTWVSGQTVINLADVKETADIAAQTANAATAALTVESARAQAAEGMLATNKADKIPALPNVVFGDVPFSVPAGRILAVNTNAVPVLTPADPADMIAFVCFGVAGTGQKFGAWTNDGGETTHFGHFYIDAETAGIINIQDWFDGSVWLSDNYLVKHGIDGETKESLGTLSGLDIDAGGDITVLAQPGLNLEGVRAELLRAVSDLSINRLTRSEFSQQGVKYKDIVDSLDSLDAKKPLSARQGNALKELIANVNTGEFAGPYETVEDIPTPYDTNDLYLVGADSPYAIYAYSVTLAELIRLGDAAVGLENYYNKTTIDAMLADLIDETELGTAITAAKADMEGYANSAIDAALAQNTETITEDTAKFAASTDFTFASFFKAAVQKINALFTLLTGKQDKLVSGTSIKTINSASLLGSGNLVVGNISARWNTGDLQTGRYLRISGLGFGAWDSVNIEVCSNNGVSNIAFRTGTAATNSGGSNRNYFGNSDFITRYGQYNSGSHAESLVINFTSQVYNVYVEVRGRSNPGAITFNLTAGGEDLGNVTWL